MSNTNSYSVISNEIISNKNLSVGAKSLYVLLSSYCFGDKKECFPSQRVLADTLGKSIRTVQRWLKELEENGIIKIQNRGYLTNLYHLLKKICINSSIKKVKEKVNNLKNKYSKKQDHFNNFDQREYDYNELEKQLLGWT